MHTLPLLPESTFRFALSKLKRKSIMSKPSFKKWNDFRISRNWLSEKKKGQNITSVVNQNYTIAN